MYYEQFLPDEKIFTRNRVITCTDIDLFTAITGATNPMFMSDAEAQKKGRRARVTPGPLLFSFTIGLCYQAGVFDQVLAMMGVNNMKIFVPVHPGELVMAQTTLVEKRPSKTPGQGVVTLAHELKNKDEKQVLYAEAIYLIAMEPVA